MSAPEEPTPQLKTTEAKRPGRSLAVTAAASAVFGAAMLAAAFASVPLYRLFCQMTGYGGTTQRAEAAPDTISDRSVIVRFDANVANGIGWAFRPEQREVRVKLGEVGHVNFIAENRTAEASTGQAGFNVAPSSAGQFFNKIACFCFNSQTLKAGERVEMPVTFFVDPAMVNDVDSRYTDTITLSYTFYPSVEAKPASQASLEPAAADPKLR